MQQKFSFQFLTCLSTKTDAPLNACICERSGNTGYVGLVLLRASIHCDFCQKDLNGQDFLRGHHSKEPPSQLTYHHNPTMPIGGLGDRAGERPFGSIKTEPTVAYLINTLLLHCAWGCVTTLTLLSPSMTLPHLDTPVPPSVLVVQQSSWISGSTQVVSEQMMLWCL